MNSTLSTTDLAAVIRRAHEEGAHVGVILGSAGDEGLVLGALARNGVETKALEVLVVGHPIPGTNMKARIPTATQHLVEAKDARLVVFATVLPGWGDEACGVLYAGQPVASVKDVTDAIEDGDGLDVRHGELWIESPAGSGQWHGAGAVLHDVARELRKHGVLVAG